MFFPPPKVTSAVVQLEALAEPRYKSSLDGLEKVVATAFNQRRKMLRSSFKMFGGSKLLEKAGINPEERPENLTLEAFCILANLIESNRF